MSWPISANRLRMKMISVAASDAAMGSISPIELALRDLLDDGHQRRACHPGRPIRHGRGRAHRRHLGIGEDLGDELVHLARVGGGVLAHERSVLVHVADHAAVLVAAIADLRAKLGAHLDRRALVGDDLRLLLEVAANHALVEVPKEAGHACRAVGARPASRGGRTTQGPEG
eukprot:scaffold82840_cov35-Phaeocystis_antarctica.AAC.1